MALAAMHQTRHLPSIFGAASGALGRATLATSALAAAGSASGREVLHNSMSDGFYDVKGRKVPEPASGGAAPARKEPEAQRPRNVRQALSSLSEPGYHNSLSDAGYLHNSLSEGTYEYRRRIVPSRVAHSMSDPLPGWLQNSMSDAHYELPQSLRGGGSLNPKPRQGFATARPQAPAQRIVVVSRSDAEPAPLHDSFAHGDYTPRKR